MNFPVFSQLAGNLACRDEFARDCLLQRRVCEPSVPARAGSRDARDSNPWSPPCRVVASDARSALRTADGRCSHEKC
jgi:hypothetical protein